MSQWWAHPFKICEQNGKIMTYKNDLDNLVVVFTFIHSHWWKILQIQANSNTFVNLCQNCKVVFSVSLGCYGRPGVFGCSNADLLLLTKYKMVCKHSTNILENSVFPVVAVNKARDFKWIRMLIHECNECSFFCLQQLLAVVVISTGPQNCCFDFQVVEPEIPCLAMNGRYVMNNPIYGTWMSHTQEW